jgi:hypothetical protein
VSARRSFLKTGVAGLGVALLPATASAEAVPSPTHAEIPALLTDLPPLDRCRVVRVHAPLFGAVPIVLEGPEGMFQVDVCRRGDCARGVAQSPSLDFFVHNGGNGSKATSPEQILAVRALASELAVRESSGLAVPELSTWEQRQQLTARRTFSVLGLAPTVAPTQPRGTGTNSSQP